MGGLSSRHTRLSVQHLFGRGKLPIEAVGKYDERRKNGDLTAPPHRLKLSWEQAHDCFT